MTQVEATGLARAHVERRLAERHEANARFFAAEGERIAALCHRAAERFARGGRLLAIGCTPTARSDVRHVAVEFVHPVIVGKRALPALALPDGGSAATVGLFGGPDDIALAFSADGAAPVLGAALAAAGERGLLTVALVGPGGDWPDVDHVITVPSDDPTVVREGHVTAYHVLWELVHVFLEAA